MIALLLAATLTDLPTVLARIAESQEKASEARKGIVYTQEVRAKLLRANGKVAREERHVYLVTPTAKGTEKKRIEFRGAYESGGKMVPFDEPGFVHKRLDIDADMMKGLVEELLNDGSRDGLGKDFFPLTRDKQREYDFRLEGNVLHFDPESRGFTWRGEMEIDPADGMPRRLSSGLSRTIPRWAQATFGTNFHQLGFSATYKKVTEGLWFPATFGTEFKFRVLFGYARTVIIDVVNRDFRKASVESSIQYDLPEAK
ncbi:MAG: hypothetical protein U0Q16_19830 [Bryobacteraceae bacterium]